MTMHPQQKTQPIPRFANHIAYKLKNFFGASPHFVGDVTKDGAVSITFSQLNGTPLIMKYRELNGQREAMLQLELGSRITHVTTEAEAWKWIMKNLNELCPDALADAFTQPKQYGVLGKPITRVTKKYVGQTMSDSDFHSLDLYMLDCLDVALVRNISKSACFLFNVRDEKRGYLRAIRQNSGQLEGEIFEIYMISPTRLQISARNDKSGDKVLVYNTLDFIEPLEILNEMAEFWPSQEESLKQKAANTG